MNQREHYEQAEVWLEGAKYEADSDKDSASESALIALVHATLAQTPTFVTRTAPREGTLDDYFKGLMGEGS